jgi:hypothetical protein
LSDPGKEERKMNRNLIAATALGALGLGVVIMKGEPGPRVLHPFVPPPTAVSLPAGVEPDPCVRSAWVRLQAMCADTSPLARCVQAAHSTVGTAACCDAVDKQILSCS